MTKRILFIVLTVALLTMLSASLAPAQQTGTLSGTVSDPSGAVVPKATVTISNEQTGMTRAVQTNASGFFTAAQLPVGNYSISATAQGFKTAERKAIDLHVAEEKTVPLVLEIGATAETVTVTGGATEVELRSGEVSNIVGSQQMTELPLNGRSFVQLTLLVPGASPGDDQKSNFTGLLGGVDISMSGSPANANAWLVDGVDNVDHGSGRTILVYPSVDSIEEFKVQRNAYGAENNAAGGAQINLVTKGGTNSFHGSAYEFFRNDKLNANNFFLNRSGIKDKPELRYNNFGYSLGGPIKKDKLFFYWSEEWRREVRGITRKRTVPTDAEKAGNFNGIHSANLPTPVDPMTGQPFPNNQIPSNRFSPAGQLYLKLLPSPTLANATVDNWVAAVPTGLQTRQEQIRADYNVSSNTQIMFRYTQDAWSNPAVNYSGEGGLWGDNGLPTVDSSWAQPSKSIAGRLTHTFGPTAINQFQFAYANNRIFITEGLGADLNNALIKAVPGVFTATPKDHYGVFWAGAPIGSLWNIAPWDNKQDIWSWKDDFTKTVGNHSLKVGALYATYIKDEDVAYDTAPSFWGSIGGGAGMGGGWGDSRAPGNGHGGVTDNMVADLLLKDTWWGGGDEASNKIRSKVRWHDIEMYFADTWRAKPRLTIDYGVRLSMLPPSYQGDDKMGNFVPGLWDPKVGTSNPTNGMIFPEDYTNTTYGIAGGAANLRGLDVGRALRSTSLWKTFAPRLGVAFDPTGSGKWAIRAGLGFFYGRPDMTMPTGDMASNPPFRSTLTWGAGRPLDYFPADVPTAGVGLPGIAIDTDWKVQGSYQWNFTIEHEVMKDTKVEIAYLGNRGHHLPYNWNMNDVRPKDMLEFARRQYAPNDALGDENTLRPFFGLKGNGLLRFVTQGANSNYHAFQAFVTKRFANNFSYQIAYTFSKLLSNTGMNCCGSGDSTRIYSPELAWYNRGPASFDRTHILSINAIYRMPTLSNYNKVAQSVLGGWELTTIYQYNSGIPLTPRISSNMVGLWENRPDLAGDPNISNPTAERWFNTNAFAVPALGKLGTSGIGYIRAPAINNMDLAIYKNFRVTERTQLQFRFETFNTLNHTQLKSIDTGFSLSGVNLVADAANNYNSFVRPDAATCPNWPACQTNSNFGRAQSVRDPREIQLALKFIF